MQQPGLLAYTKKKQSFKNNLEKKIFQNMLYDCKLF